jgi:hypothetical protein
MLAQSQRTTRFYLTKFVVENFFHEVLPSARFQPLNAVLLACFKPKNEAILPDNTSRLNKNFV